MKRFRQEAAIPFSHFKSSISCPICHEVITEATTLKKCLHRFCGSCLELFFTTSNTSNASNSVRNCPVCRCHLPSKREKHADENFRIIIQQLTTGLADTGVTQNFVFNREAAVAAHRDRVKEIRLQAQKLQEELRRNPPPPPPRVQPKSKRHRPDDSKQLTNTIIRHTAEPADLEGSDDETIPFVNLCLKNLVSLIELHFCVANYFDWFALSYGGPIASSGLTARAEQWKMKSS